MDVFLPKIKQNIRLNRVYLLFKNSQESINICPKDNKRWQYAWNYLEKKLTKKFRDDLIKFIDKSSKIKNFIFNFLRIKKSLFKSIYNVNRIFIIFNYINFL